MNLGKDLFNLKTEVVSCNQKKSRYIFAMLAVVVLKQYAGL